MVRHERCESIGGAAIGCRRDAARSMERSVEHQPPGEPRERSAGSAGSAGGPAPDARETIFTAIGLSDRFELEGAVRRLGLKELLRTSYGRTLADGDDRRIHLIGLGAVVVTSPRPLAGGPLEPELGARLEAATGRKLLPETREVYRVRVDPACPAGSARVGWDLVVVPLSSPELDAAVALLLAQSAALVRYELAAQRLVDEALALSALLDERGGIPRSTRELVRRIGRLARTRLELARWFYFVDRPEETWEDARVAQLYDALFENLELGERHRAVQHKHGVVEQATRTWIDLWQARRSNALEWAIVLLIVFEIAMALVRGF